MTEVNRTVVIERIAVGSPAYDGAVALRDRVLRVPLGRPSARVELERDRTGEHFAAIEEGAVIGTLALYAEEPGTNRLRSMAVAPEAQGRGVGAALVAFAERAAIANGAGIIEAEARTSALPFYQACGLEIKSEEYISHSVTHRWVRKELARS